MNATNLSNEVFCQVMCIAYEINRRRPDWSMEKCIEQAVKGAYAITDLQPEKTKMEDKNNV